MKNSPKSLCQTPVHAPGSEEIGTRTPGHAVLDQFSPATGFCWVSTACTECGRIFCLFSPPSQESQHLRLLHPLGSLDVKLLSTKLLEVAGEGPFLPT